MFMKDMKRFAFFLVLTLLFLYASGSWFGSSAEQWPPSGEHAAPQSDGDSHPSDTPSDSEYAQPPVNNAATPDSGTDFPNHDDEDPPVEMPARPPPAGDGATEQAAADGLIPTHQEIFSQSTVDRKYFTIDFGKKQAINPNIIPHPTLDNTWIVVAQETRSSKSDEFVEIVCDAKFERDVLRCLDVPAALPIAATPGGNCEGELEFFNLNQGPHDARVFFGPERSYVVYGSNSRFTCFGQFIQDFAILRGWKDTKGKDLVFETGTELQRPAPWGAIEKNWFLFWDADDQPYVHYDLLPQRVFAKVGSDGSVGSDLAPRTASSDDKCFEKYLPEPASEQESVHQATNSLLVTLCRRSEPSCVADDDNTFIITIFQHKTFYNFHSVYEPYIMAFRRKSPFQVHGISRRPLWISGRQVHADRGTSDMLYVTSMGWKSRKLQYHGFIDDELFLAFGIEDESAGGIDILAGDLIGELGLCNGPSGSVS
ncbi:hypothetical protein ACO1O0_005814 [Amphichorda felina]